MPLRRLVIGSILALFGIFSRLQAGEPPASTGRLQSLVEKLSSNNAQTRQGAEQDLDSRSRAYLESLGRFELDGLAARKKFRDQVRPLAPTLLKLLDSPDDDCRASAALLLATMGPDAAFARPQLLKIVQTGIDEAPGVWIAAALALPHVSPPEQAIGPQFLKAFAQIAAQQMGELERSRPTSKDGKQEGEADPVAYTSGFLGMIVGKTLIDAGRTQIELPALLEMTNVKYPRLMRAAAISALQIFQREGAAAEPTLWKLLQDTDPLIRRVAAGALLCITNDPAVIPAIIARSKLSAAEKQEFRKSAQVFLDEEIQRRERTRETPYLTQCLVRDAVMMLIHGNPVHRRYAVQMLSELWPGTRTVVKSFVSMNFEGYRGIVRGLAGSLDRLPQLCASLSSLSPIPALLPVELSLAEVASKDRVPTDRSLPIRSASRDPQLK